MSARIVTFITLLAAGLAFAQPAFDPAGTWQWRCCNNRHSGSFVIDRLERDGTFRGKFGNSGDDAGTPLSGRISGTTIEFNRHIGNQVQRWAGTVTSDGQQASGTCTGYGLTAPQSFSATRPAPRARPADVAAPAATSNTTISVQNGPYHSTWRQRGSSSTWDAVWSGPGTITTVMEGSIQGNQVIMRRTTSSDGHICEYRGTIAADGVSVSGMQTCPGLNPAPWTGRLGTGVNEPRAPQSLQSLTGPWVHSADAGAPSSDNRVILVQDSSRVTLTHSYKTSGNWVTLVCQGSISGRALRMPCAWAPGGNPFGFGNPTLDLKISSDGNHLDGTIGSPGGTSQQSHYSRLP